MDQIFWECRHELPELPAPRHFFRGRDAQLLPLVHVLDAGLGRLRPRLGVVHGCPGCLVEGRVGGCVGLDVVQEGGVAGEVALEDVRGFPAPGLGFLSRQPVQEGKGTVERDDRLYLLASARELEVRQFLPNFVFSVFREISPGFPSPVLVLVADNHDKVSDGQVLDPVDDSEAHSSARDELVEIHGGHCNLFLLWFSVWGFL